LEKTVAASVASDWGANMFGKEEKTQPAKDDQQAVKRVP
jgi:hypothetical protein